MYKIRAKKRERQKNITLREGFEPARGDPIGFQVQCLNHSAITAYTQLHLIAESYRYSVREFDGKDGCKSSSTCISLIINERGSKQQSVLLSLAL